MVEENNKWSPSSARRSSRLKQLKKILPSDRISIEKHFPRLWNSWRFPDGSKCNSSLKLRGESRTHLVQDLRTSVLGGADDENRPVCCGGKRLTMLRTGEVKILEAPTKCVSSTIDDDNNKTAAGQQQRRHTCSNLEPAAADVVESSIINMADHLAEITLQRGCWLQATTSTNSSTAAPQILFTHRKNSCSGGQIPTRAQLAVEVMEEFERQKQSLLRRNKQECCCCYCERPAFARSSYQKSLPIFNRASINLHTRRVS